MFVNKWVEKNVVILLCAFLLSVSLITVFPDDVEAKCTYVSGYTKKNGTRVSGYYRGCGSTSTDDKSYNSTFKSNNNYYGASKIINLYKGKNLVGTSEASKLIYVQGYYRADGTYVRPHYKTHPNNYLYDNFSYLGISSLTPKEKYPQFQFNSDKDIALKEKYLLYNLEEHNLNANQLEALKTYTIALNDAQNSEEKKQFAIDLGMQFYSNLGLERNLATINSGFDLYGVITLEDYLYNVAHNINPSYEKLIGDIPFIETYAGLLKQAKYDPTKLKVAQNYGTKFYKIIGASSGSINNQLEMDELQTFDIEQINHIELPNTILSNTGYSLSKDVVRNYLIDVGTNYNLVFNFDVILDSISYQTALELLYGGSEYFLKSAFTEGTRFYIKHGLSDSDAINQTIKDINVILSN